MKYLILLFLIGTCLTDDNGINIQKYTVNLNTFDSNSFSGSVILTLNEKEGNKTVILDTGKLITITDCRYKPKGNQKFEEEGENEKQCEYTKCGDNKTELKFPEDRADNEVTLEFKGEYGNDGLKRYSTSDHKSLFVANMMDKAKASNIFPCQENKTVELEITDYENKKPLISNIQDAKNVDLNKFYFIFGDIKKFEKNENKKKSIDVYGMNNLEKPEYLDGFFEALSEMGEDSLTLLLTPFDLDTNIPDLICWSDDVLRQKNVSSHTELLAWEDLGYEVLRRPFAGKEKQEFPDIALPAFLSLQTTYDKISNKSLDEFILSQLLDRALEMDANNNSKPLKEQIENQKKHILRESILYTKGILMIKWLHSICVNDTFIKGVKTYFSKNDWSEAFQKCFSDSKESADSFYKDWIEQPGYPVLHMKLNKPGEYNITQERFLYNGGNREEKWNLTVKYVTDNGTKDQFELNSIKNIKIDGEYFIINNGYEGFYRVNYDERIWKALTSNFMKNHSKIDEVNRALLINDIFSFPRSINNFSQPIPNYVDALTLTNYLDNEKDYLPLKAAFKAFEFLDSALTNALHKDFQDHVKKIVVKLYEAKDVASGAEDEIKSWACRLGVESCVKNATEVFDNFALNNSLTESDIEENRVQLCSAVRNDIRRWSKLYRRTIKERCGTSRNALIKVLSCTRDNDTLFLFLSSVLDKNRTEEFVLATRSIVESNPDNINIFLSVITELKEEIKEVLGEEYLVDVVTFVLPKLNQESAKTLKELVKSIDINDVKEEVDKAVNNVKEWTDKKATGVRDFVKGSGSHAQPIALVLILSAVIPFVNYVFNN